MSDDRLFASDYVTDSTGKKHKIFPAKIKDIKTIRECSLRVYADAAIMNILTPITDTMPAKEDVPDKEYFSDEPYQALMELMVLAFGGKYTEKEIEEFLDVKMIPEVIDKFYSISELKKKTVPMEVLAAGAK